MSFEHLFLDTYQKEWKNLLLKWKKYLPNLKIKCPKVLLLINQQSYGKKKVY